MTDDCWLKSGRDGDLEISLPPLAAIPDNDDLLMTVLESDGDDRHRLGISPRVHSRHTDYIVVVGS